MTGTSLNVPLAPSARTSAAPSMIGIVVSVTMSDAGFRSPLHCLPTVAGEHDFVALIGEDVFQQIGDAHLIVDDQNSRQFRHHAATGMP